MTTATIKDHSVAATLDDLVDASKEVEGLFVHVAKLEEAIKHFQVCANNHHHIANGRSAAQEFAASKTSRTLAEGFERRKALVDSVRQHLLTMTSAAHGVRTAARTWGQLES